MYYYGYNGGYAGGNSMCYNTYPAYYNGGSYSIGIILVLFILLVIIFGAGFWNNGGRINN